MSWVEQSLETIAKCELGKMLDKKKNKGEYQPYLSNVDVRWGSFDLENLKEMRFESREFERYSLKGGDIIMCEGGEAGRCAIWKGVKSKMMYQKALHRIRTKKNIDSGFLFYQFLNMGNNREFEPYYTGSTIKHLPLQILKKIPINIPSLHTQKRIADILSAYDDLIENNLKRIKLLEQAAQNIYKEWFVNLRFPGHENTPINEETGLPEGWTEKGVCEFNSFKQYKTKIKPFEGEKEFLATSNVNGVAIHERGDFFSYEKKPSRAQIHPPLNSVWFARMSKTYKVLFLTEKSNNDYMISSGFAGFKAEKKEYLPFLFCIINSSIFSELKDNYASGSTQVSINNKSLNSIKLIEPSHDFIEKFGALTYDSLELIKHLFTTNQKLKAARDILLPRLMNRTIEV